MTAVSAYTSLGFSVAAVFAADGEARATAMYASARSVALALASLIPFFYSSTAFLTAIALVMILVQGLDAVIGFRRHETLETFGPATTALLNLLALAWLL